MTKEEILQHIQALNFPCSDRVRVIECILIELLKEKLEEEERKGKEVFD